MLIRLSNVIFYLCYAASIFFIGAGMTTLDADGFIICLGFAVSSFCVGWGIRYILTGEKTVWVPAWLKKIAQKGHASFLRAGSTYTTPQFRSAAKEKATKYAKNTVIVIVAFIAFGVAKFAVMEGMREYRITSALEKIESDPSLNAFMTGFKKRFPAEYAEFLGKAREAMNKKYTQEKARETGFQYMKDFVERNKSYIRYASNETIHEIIVHSSLLATKLQKEDEKLCADFAMRGLSSSSHLPDSLMTTMMNVSLHVVTAIYEGKHTPQLREDVSETHFIKVVEGLQEQGVPDTHIESLLAGETTHLSAKDECAIGIALYKAAETMPKHISGNLFSYILSIPDAVKP